MHMHTFFCMHAALLAPPAAGILTDPGPLCLGERATLTCEVPGVVLLLYETTQLRDVFNPLPTVEVDGIVFSISMVSTATDPISIIEISFVPTSMANNTSLACIGLSRAGIHYGIVTLQVQNISKLLDIYT